MTAEKLLSTYMLTSTSNANSNNGIIVLYRITLLDCEREKAIRWRGMELQIHESSRTYRRS